MTKLTRRELLTTFLGTTFALTACRNEGPRPPSPDGEIVGQNVDLGHLLRTDRRLEVPPGNWKNTEVVVIGAGIAGLTAAAKLIDRGVTELIVLELETHAGGTSRSDEGSPVAYPWGAHYLPVPFPENTGLIELLDEMGLLDGRTEDGPLVKEEFLCREPEERVFYKGRWYPGLYLHAGESNDDRRQLQEFQSHIERWVGWRGAGRRAFVLPVADCADNVEATDLDRISFDEWLNKNALTSERLRWYCDYACRDDYGLKLEQTSAWAGLFYFCSRVRNSGSESQKFITFPEGNGRFVNFFRKKIGDHLRTGHAVIRIEPNPGGAEVICLANNEVHGYRCRKVIFASPVFLAPYVISGFDRPLHAFRQNAWFVANLFLKDRPGQRFTRDYPLAWDNVLYESPSLGYVTATHQKGIDYGPTILTYYYPMCAEPDGRTKLFEYDHAQLSEVCLADLERAHSDIRRLVSRIDIMRWGHAMVSPVPGLIWGNERRVAASPFRSIHFAHTDLSGLALFEEAFYHGMRAANEVADSLRS